ncbi:MAG: succinyldiaminopimelate transaminase [Alcanivorax sp.]|uniref:succinyldiaminopimelate transaminase n=1 Tax=unclassified Ketobacter TaxID=2639109 RepID=UPI000F1F4D1C|nr:MULTISPECIES: succinyldiaminopimelate transaminase [unclassified Ketobacter]RLT88521.1 MAG: succinyldiaminopimelate transaminase [Ketobacter sp. GenoA1]RLT95405.1 MAG: succinyldiaminopimelate transaminase [Ketobacter sp.]TNC89699.1 MAG: succinyldiaminopimelate transaminase [Alcanivorax sp.]
MNSDLQKLQPYPFEKLAQLFSGAQHQGGLPHIALSIGEPKHASPAFVKQSIIDHIDKLAVYPTTKGLPALRQAIANWAAQRFQLNTGGLCPDTQVLPVNGTREALFAFTQVATDRTQPDGLVVSPNPFYQIYEGAAYLAGVEPHFLPCLPEHGFVPDYDSVPESVWQRCQLLFLCSPGNPTGAVTDQATLQKLIQLADEYDFIIASDECYSEIYGEDAAPPVGLLQACNTMGRTDFKRCVVFHSLSKRSNLPGLRSGFVAGDAGLLAAFLQYRTYHGCAMPVQHQLASIAAWSDESHVQENRRLYQQKFTAVLSILGDVLEVQQPDAGFYLWPKTPTADTDFARSLFQQQHVTVLPGRYLSRTIEHINPGEHRVRMALVAPLEQCIEAAERIKQFVQS